jgi:hypothetical protein
VPRLTLSNIRRPDYAAQLALFLLEKTGSIWGRHRAHMTAAEQRALFGRFIGKGAIIIDGTAETICMRAKVGFGLDWDDRHTTRWSAL